MILQHWLQARITGIDAIVLIMMIKIEAQQILTSMPAPKWRQLLIVITCLVIATSVFPQSRFLVIVTSAPCLMM